MLSSLMLTAFLMGLGGVPHCAAMCGAACAALLPNGVPLTSLLGRCVGYALLGAVAAVGFGAAAQWGRQVSFLQPLWIMALALALSAAVYFGVLLLWRHQPNMRKLLAGTESRIGAKAAAPPAASSSRRCNSPALGRRSRVSRSSR